MAQAEIDKEQSLWNRTARLGRLNSVLLDRSCLEPDWQEKETGLSFGVPSGGYWP